MQKTEDRYNQKLAEAENKRSRYGFTYFSRALTKEHASFIVLFPNVRMQPKKSSFRNELLHNDRKMSVLQLTVVIWTGLVRTLSRISNMS